ncbi:ABC transporter permease [Solibacillus sp. CAU 1738]|uniref:ABC transporter permease n=1 Tax=Solibacillus sp. CAU 1738 TaxID=3140363 RepID=UPI0032600D9E
MINILKTKFLLLMRRPGSYITITIVTCIFTYIMGIGQEAKQPVAVHSELDEVTTEQVINKLEKMMNYEITIYNKSEATKQVKSGQVDVAIFLQEKNYDLLVSIDFMNATLLQNELNMIYSDMLQQSAIINAFPEEKQGEIANVIAQSKTSPIFTIQYTNFENEEGFKWDGKLHSLLGFTLFMVIYTVANGVNHIVMERRNGIWNRLTVSSIHKWEVYVANLTYTFLLGYLQIVLVFSIFYFGVDVDFYGGFANSLIAVIPYLLCVVAICIFVASVTNTPGKFNAIMVVIAVPFAMLGGAYWPLEIVTSKVILALSYISPITYGLEILKGVTINGSTFAQLFQPLSLLLFMTVVFMGIGINVLERKD